MPSSSQAAATQRQNDRMIIMHEPPKLKTILKTPPKQATNPLQFVKVGPCSLYRSAQEQLEKVKEVKKIKEQVRDDPEDWQSNLDNWKSSRRKRQEHIIERVVEVKKLELEEHDRQRRRSKTFSEMMEERSNRGKKLSVSLAMYQEEDSNDLSDLGIGTSSGKSSVSGDTHDDTQSVLSDRDSEIDKNHSDVDNTNNENGNGRAENNNVNRNNIDNNKTNEQINNKTYGFHNDQREYDSGTTATSSSPEPEEYRGEEEEEEEEDDDDDDKNVKYNNFEGEFVSSRVSLINLDKKLDNNKSNLYKEITADDKNNSDIIKVDVFKRREMFEKASINKSTDCKVNNNDNNNNNHHNHNINNRSSGDFTNCKTVKERLSNLEKQKPETNQSERKLNRHSGDMSSIRERLTYLEKQKDHEKIYNKTTINDLNSILPLRNQINNLEVNPTTSNNNTSKFAQHSPHQIVLTPKSNNINNNNNNNNNNNKIPPQINDKKPSLIRFNNQDNQNEISTPSERSSSPDSEYRSTRTSRAPFHRSLDSLDADASSGPDTFERVQSLEELDYERRRYPTSISSGEILNDTDREDSGIQTTDVSCSVSQADEPVDEEITVVQQSHLISQFPQLIDETNQLKSDNDHDDDDDNQHNVDNDCMKTVETELFNLEIIKMEKLNEEKVDTQLQSAVIIEDSSAVQDNKKKGVELCTESALLHEHEPTTIESIMDIETFDLSIVYPNIKQQQHDNLSNDFIITSLSKPIPSLNLVSDEEIINGLKFPLGPPSSAEPPKEKPPPPPSDLSDEENLPIEPLKRLNSTRRIKKELRTRRSDFLGIKGINDDELELSLARPPDMAAILAEERRTSSLLHHRRSYDTDSNYEQDSSHERDSGVELGHVEDWIKQPVSPDMSQHSRQSSEPFAASVTSSEEDEIMKKEREIIEVLEKDDQWRYGSNHQQNSELKNEISENILGHSDIGEKLAHKLRELEEETMLLERERLQETFKHQKTISIPIMKDVDQMNFIEKDKFHLNKEESVVTSMRMNDDMNMRSMMEDRQKIVLNDALSNHHDDEYQSTEVLRVLNQLEQEELKRQRNNKAYHQQKQQQLAKKLEEQWQSLQDINKQTLNNQPMYQNINVINNYRSSMPNLELQDVQRRKTIATALAPVPAAPPIKPLRLIEQRQRDVTMRNSRIPSTDCIQQQQMDTVTCQQMTKQTLHALSAVPRTRIVKSDQWVQRRKSDDSRATHDFNYQHWLIQEAEQRRINEKNQRLSPRSVQHITSTSVPYSPTSSSSSSAKVDGKPLPDSVIQTIRQRIQNRVQDRPVATRRSQEYLSHQSTFMPLKSHHHQSSGNSNNETQEKVLSVSGKKKCSHCGDELGRGAAMIIESLRLFYHIDCFKCFVCYVRLGDGHMGTDVRVRNHKLHCHNCYSSDDGVKFSCV